MGNKGKMLECVKMGNKGSVLGSLRMARTKRREKDELAWSTNGERRTDVRIKHSSCW